MTEFLMSGSRSPNTRTPGEQQLRGCQHQHRPRGQRVVRCPRRVLGGAPGAVRAQQGGLPARQLVAQDVRPDGVQHPVLQVHAEAGRGRLDQHGLCPLGPGGGMVQQRGLEHGASDPPPVRGRHREVRVEQVPEVPVHRGHGLPHMEYGSKYTGNEKQQTLIHSNTKTI